MTFTLVDTFLARMAEKYEASVFAWEETEKLLSEYNLWRTEAYRSDQEYISRRQAHKVKAAVRNAARNGNSTAQGKLL